MSAENLTDASPDKATRRIERRLHHAWRKERRLHNLRGLCFVLVWAAALVVMDLLVDWLFLANYRVPWYGRTVLLGINVVTLIVVLWHYWLRYLTRYNAVRVALQVERKHPELQSLLVSFVQMDAEHQAHTHASPFLVRAFRRQALELSSGINFREIVNFKDLQKLLLFCVCVLGGFAAVSAYKSDFFGTLLRRMLLPTSNLEYPTDTVIDEERITGSVTIQEGAPLTLAVRCDGVIPEQGTLRLRAEGAAWESLPLLKRKDAVFAYQFVSVPQSFDYYIRLGDDRSEIYRVEVIPAPKVLRREIVLDYPAYTGIKQRTQQNYYIEVLEGSTVTWRLTTDLRLKAADVKRNNIETSAMRLRDNGFSVEGKFDALDTFEYHFRWHLADHPFVYRSRGRYIVNVIPDAPPEVEILSPGPEEKATTKKSLTISFRAKDDYGLADARLVYSINNGPKKSTPLTPLKGLEVEKTVRRKLSSLIRGLRENDVVEYSIEVADNRSSKRGPNFGKSRTRRVYIVSVAEYLRTVLEQYQRWLTEVQSLRGEEMQAAQKVDDLKPVPSFPTSAPAASGPTSKKANR